MRIFPSIVADKALDAFLSARLSISRTDAQMRRHNNKIYTFVYV